MNDKGQSILSEYVMIFFVVIAAAVGMTTYVQRGYQARIASARDFAFTSLISSGACDANCVMAAGGNIYVGYEPYYLNSIAMSDHHEAETSTASQGNAQALGVVYTKSLNENTNTDSWSSPSAPCAAPGGWC